MGRQPALSLKFWGVRGSIPTPQLENLSYGGNTPCIEIRSSDDQVLIFDGGTGIKNLGRCLVTESGSKKLTPHIFLTHFHWDHIQGIPFFEVLYRPENNVTFYSSATLAPLEDKLQGIMSRPYFPVSFDMLKEGRRSFIELASTPARIGDLQVSSFPLNHPQGAVGYRIESPNAVVVYASDLEHGNHELDRLLREYAEGADLLIYDAQYTPKEYETHRGWGHSTWLEGTRVARDSKVKQLILFHHDPWHDDQTLFSIAQIARFEFENTTVASEGWLAIL
jgi:phosphoribosyl 1,2-cyclic phosphodiesterase